MGYKFFNYKALAMRTACVSSDRGVGFKSKGIDAKYAYTGPIN